MKASRSSCPPSFVDLTVDDRAKAPRRTSGWSLRSAGSAPHFRRSAAATGTLGQAGDRLGGEVLDHRLEAPGLAVDTELPVGAGALPEEGVDVLDLGARAELVDHVVDELQQLQRQLPHRHLSQLAEVDQLAVDAPAHGPPLVLADQAGQVLAEAEVPRPQDQELGADRLDQRGDAHDLVHPGARVADAELDGRVLPVRSQVPPDLLAIVDAVGPHQQLDVVAELVVGAELWRDPG